MRSVLIAAGAAAGLSAAFNAPIAGLLFVVEEVYHHFLSSCLGDSFNGIFSSQCCFPTHLWPGTSPCYDRKITRISFEGLLDSIVLGIFLGVLGYGYEWVVLRIGKVYQGLGKIFHLPSHFHGLLAVLFYHSYWSLFSTSFRWWE